MDDKELYRRFLSGDEEGLRLIMEKYRPWLTFFVNSIVHSISTADEIVEDTFADLVIKRPHYSGSGSFKTWLYSIARNRALRYMRRNSIYVPLTDDLDESFSDWVALPDSFQSVART